MRNPLQLLFLCALVMYSSCKVSNPGRIETMAARKAKKVTIGGKDWKNPVPDNSEAVGIGARAFRQQCQVCHGLDGHNTGVPFADRMSPPVADLGGEDTQAYSDGQLKWIIENGIRFTGMPGWNGLLKDDEMWYVVRFMRHLPQQGSLGIPSIFQQSQEQELMTKGTKTQMKVR